MSGVTTIKVLAARALLKRIDAAVLQGPRRRDLSVWVPNKRGKEIPAEAGSESPAARDAKAALEMEPITVFSRPPPLPPVLTPLLAFSLLEMGLDSDTAED